MGIDVGSGIVFIPTHRRGTHCSVALKGAALSLSFASPGWLRSARLSCPRFRFYPDWGEFSCLFICSLTSSYLKEEKRGRRSSWRNSDGLWVGRVFLEH